MKKLTPSQSLWAEVFGPLGIPDLDEAKVLSLLECLDERHRLAICLRFGFKGRPMTFAKMAGRLPSSYGRGIGLTKERARQLVHEGVTTLKRYRGRWKNAVRV